MKKFLLILGILLAFGNVTFAKNLKFVQVTDVHMTQASKAEVQAFVNDINKNSRDLDFVVFTGDNIDKASLEDLSTFLDIVKKLHVRPYILVGNHDLSRHQGVSNRDYMKLVRRKLGWYHSSKPNYVFKKGNTIFIAMNGVKEIIPGPNGYYRTEELAWLDKQLTKYKNKRVVILQHFSLLDTREKGHNLYKKDDYIEVLNKHDNVMAIISGHYHHNNEKFEYGVYNIVTQNFNHNKYHKLIEIDEAHNLIFTSLIEND